ncbi:MAG: hypothetical protein EPO40_32565 [Myxococcaceae bacterium]|nr:MAG: hypothetical protein EPO40_32565 [Myxococcaceae bacterium]
MSIPYRERWRGPRPQRPGITLAALVFLCSAALCAFTSHKLAVMSRLRGWTPGAPQRVMTVEHILRRFNASMGEYQLVDAHGGTWKMQLTAEQLDRIGYHQPVAVRCLEDERECFVPDSVYISDGNFGFDHALRALESLGMLASGLRVGWRLRAWRREVRAWEKQAPSPVAQMLN